MSDSIWEERNEQYALDAAWEGAMEEFLAKEFAADPLGRIKQWLEDLGVEVDEQHAQLVASTGKAGQPGNESHLPNDLISKQAALAKFHVSESTLYRHRKGGKIKGYRDLNSPGNAVYYFRVSDLARHYKPKLT